ncbi:hypothetical protein CHS0354_017023 [Potamilus streckersoni]|uniref:Uncharacterized protein n=1 Tax=Potamilus streckersoni TaxID=2493646 RepID=A0AAE0W597_9BIVA|nr:hypothetical protein CHS0354_017023 [Potamilus streckersoni]
MKRIFSLDSSLENKTYVISHNLNGSDEYRFTMKIKTLEMIEMYKRYLLVTARTTNGTLLMSYYLDDKSVTTSGVLSGTNISAIKIYDETIRQNETGTIIYYFANDLTILLDKCENDSTESL